MKHNFLVLFAGCGALTAVGFAGSHAQTARASVQCTPVCAQAPVAVVIAPDGSRSVATCVASTCVATPHVNATYVTSPCVAVVCCDPKQGRAAPSVVRVSTGGSGQVTVCGSGNGVYSVGYGSVRNTSTTTAVGSGSNGVCVAGPNSCSAGQGSCSAGSSSCSAGQGSCSAGVGSGSVTSTSVGAATSTSVGSGTSTSVSAGNLMSLGGGGSGPLHSNNLTSAGPLVLTGQTLSGPLTLTQSPTLVAQGGGALQLVDLGQLVQGLRGSVGTLVAQDPAGADSDDAPDMPEVADVEDMDAPDMDDDSGDDMAPDVAWSSGAWKEDVEQALEQARAQVAGADDETREAIEQAQAEVARAQSGWASGDAQRAYKEAMEKAQVEWHAAMADSARAHAEAGAQQRASSVARAQAQAQAERSKEQQERMMLEMRATQDGQQKRARAEGEARGGFAKRSSGDAGLEERVEALEKIAKARGREVSGGGSLESRVAELERSMRGNGDGDAPVARAPRAVKVVEVPRGGVFTTPDGVKRLEFARPSAPRAMPRVATPPTPRTPPTSPTPVMPRTFAPKVHVGGMNGMSGMDADTRLQIEKAMSDLRSEAARLREEMSKLRSEIDRLPRDSGR